MFKVSFELDVRIINCYKLYHKIKNKTYFIDISSMLKGKEDEKKKKAEEIAERIRVREVEKQNQEKANPKKTRRVGARNPYLLILIIQHQDHRQKEQDVQDLLQKINHA